ncbi:hypothetical protein KAR91_35255 [Candidatus Pacearchaeota archaeon]|nr:hypothetical protein [Candidatus Pacearchaeota archaeon]
MKTMIETYETAGEVEMYEVYVITCPDCDNAEEMPIDEQHWHTQNFDHLDVDFCGDNHTYKCCDCGCVFMHMVKEPDGWWREKLLLKELIGGLAVVSGLGGLIWVVFTL